MSVRAGPFLALVLLFAGCSSSENPADDGANQPDGSPGPSSSPGASNTDAPEPLADKEVLNTTLTFPSPPSMTGDSATFTIPTGYGEFYVLYDILANCPGGVMTAPRLALVNPDGEDVVVSGPVTVQETAPEPYTCGVPDLIGMSPNQSLDATGWPSRPALAGTWTIETRGQLTGVGEIVVVAVQGSGLAAAVTQA